MTDEEIQKKLDALDNKYKEHITGLNLQIAAMSTQYSALSMQYSLLMARVDVLESLGLQELPDVNDPPESSVPVKGEESVAGAVFIPNTAARHEAMNKPPKVVKRAVLPNEANENNPSPLRE